MERYESAARDADTRIARKAEDAPATPASTTPDETSQEPAPEDQVTPYDHLWFDRRPLS